MSREEYDEARALHLQGWSVSAIARHLSRDRKTVRSYLTGRRKPGVRRTRGDSLQRFATYCRLRLADSAHLPASDLHDEITELGYRGGYSTFTRALRRHRLRPVCPACSRNPGADPTEPRRTEKVHFSLLRLPGQRPRWGCGNGIYLMVGRLGDSGRWRAVLVDGDGFPHVVEAIDEVLRRLGGTGGRWILAPSVLTGARTAGRPLREFAQVAEHYGTSVEAAPPSGERGGALPEEDLRQIRGAWWSISSTCPLPIAQDRFDQLAIRLDVRRTQALHRSDREGAAPLLPLPDAPYPAQLCAMRTVDPQGLVPFRGNTYAVAAQLAGAVVEVRWRLGESHISIATTSGSVLAHHVLAPRGARRTVPASTGPIALERHVRSQRPQGRCGSRCHSGYVPPSPAAAAEARRLGTRGPEAAGLGPEQHARAVIAQAKTVLAAHRGIDVEEAFTVLRDWAHAHRMALAALARSVVSMTADQELLAGPDTRAWPE